MGRWAEVYFTAAPEKREEAVLELLRELGAAPPVPPAANTPERLARESPQPFATSPQVPTPSPESIEEVEQEWIVCETCGGRNTVGNRFCGMCATPLPQANNATLSPTKGMWGSTATRPNDITNEHTSDQDERYGYKNSRQEDTRYENGRYENGHADQEFHEPIGLEAAAESRASRSSTSNWPDRPAVPSLIPEYDEAPSRRRLYVGAMIALIIAGLVYFAWRKSSAASESAHTLPAPVPAVSETQPAASDQAPPPTEQAGSNPVPSSKAQAALQRSPAAASGRPVRKSDIAGRQTNPAPTAVPALPTSDQAGGPIVASIQDNGAAELVVAENYLNGTHGKTRDTGEAAKWLWRSFGKKNGAAALLLSELYVRGDGVPQNCDQARLLLDAAARKGTSGAAEQLRNLPSRGCQ